MYLRILSYSKKYPLEIFSYLIFVILMVLFSGLSLTLLDPVLSLLFSNNMEVPTVSQLSEPEISVSFFKEWIYYQVAQKLVLEGKEQALLMFIFIIVGMNILGNVFRYLANFFEAKVKTRSVEQLRKELFNSLTQKPVSYIENNRKGDIINRLTNDVSEVERSIINTMQAIFKDPFYIGFFLFLMIQYSLSLTGFIFLVLPITAIFISTIGKSLKRKAKKSQEVFSNMLSVVEETISGIRIIKAFNAEKYTKDVFEKENRKYSSLNRKQLYRRNMASPFSESMGVVAVGFILWYGGALVFKGELEASGFIIYIFLFTRILQPAKSFSQAFSNIYKGIASAERIFGLMDAKVTIKDKPNAIKAKPFSKSIELKNVSFSYTDEPVLKNLSYTIEKGKFYALVGPSGCGKSTTAELFLRFYDPTEGVVLFDGIDIKDIEVKSIRDQVAIVTQEPILFNDSIYNNISFGLPNITKDKVIEAAKAANAHEFIMETANGYDTEIGDRGALLSGGQRQRISIARALLKDPAILLLDEATSALDTESERIVQDALQALMKDRTSLVIAHRLSTIQNADCILVMNKGEVVEQGTHKELIARDGLYKKLTQMQQLDS